MWKPYAKNLNHYYWVSAALITGWTQQYAPILSNSFDILTPAWTPFYIVGVRVIVIIQMSIFLVYLSLWDESVKLQKADKLKETSESSTPTDSAVNGTSSNVDQTQGYYSASKAFLRLSFSIYLSNYYFIRSDFFTERTLFYNTFLSFVKRLVSSMFFILVTSFVFQIIFLGPFTNLRVSLLRRLSAGKTNKKNE
ncbi:hypothetical protein HDE_04185 [Halotydeus destructor]|nr:hypothetical protein HDE_04185 [Halotydeus destructor]